MAEEELIDFLNHCRLKNFEVMLYLRCSSLFDKEATKSLESFILESKKRGKWSADYKPKFSFTKSYIPSINNTLTTNYVNKNSQGKTFMPYAKAPIQKWVHSTHKNGQYGKNNMVKDSTSNIVTKNVTTDTENQNESTKYAYCNNYKGKNPMTRTQWRRYQRSKNGIAANTDVKAVDPKVKEDLVEIVKRLIKEKLSLPPIEENTVGVIKWIHTSWIQNQISKSCAM